MMHRVQGRSCRIIRVSVNQMDRVVKALTRSHVIC